MAEHTSHPSHAHVGNAPTITFMPGQWYVMDRFATSAQRAYMSGPFGTAREAEIDRRELNIADDCDVWQCPGEAPSATQVHSLSHEVAEVPQDHRVRSYDVSDVHLHTPDAPEITPGPECGHGLPISGPDGQFVRCDECDDGNAESDLLR